MLENKVSSNKESKRLQKRMHEEAQTAYIKVGKARYEKELSHCITSDDLEALRVRWIKVSELLADGWIIDFEAVDIFKGIG